MKWIYLLTAIVAEIIGTSALNASDAFTRLWPSVITVAAYSVAFYLLALTLREIPVGVAYAIWSGVGIALIALVGFLFFDQRLDAPALIGIGLIVAGVLGQRTCSPRRSGIESRISVRRRAGTATIIRGMPWPETLFTSTAATGLGSRM